MPLALGGRLLFEGASCEACRLVIQPIEEFCLRKMFFRYRVRKGFPSRHRKEWPDHFPVYVGDDYATRIDVPTAEYPRYLALPVFPLPGIMLNRDPESEVRPQLCLIMKKEDSQAVKAYGPKGTLGPQQINVRIFARMLAKIAHALAVASLTDEQLAKLTLLLPNLIIHDQGKALHLVGMNSTTRPAQKGELHESVISTSVRDGQHFLVARIRLFSDMGTPDYVVVIARSEAPLAIAQVSPEAARYIGDKNPDPDQ